MRRRPAALGSSSTRWEADPSLDYPLFVAGKRRTPPEDVGGPGGFMDFVEAISNRSHPRHKEMARWYGGPFHPTNFGEAEIAAPICEIVLRRKTSLEAFQRSRKDLAG